MENILLDSTKKLQIKLDSNATTNQCDITVSYVDTNASGVVVDDGAQESRSNGTTAQDILSSPSSGMRNALTVTVVNNDTIQHTFYIYKVTGAGSFLVTEQTLAAGASWDSNINNYLFDWAAAINNAAAGVLQNGSKIGIWDVLSGALRSVTISNLLNFIQSQFNSLFMPIVAPGTSGNVLTSNGSAWTSAAPSGGGGGGVIPNEILNGGFDLYCRQIASTYTTIATDKYGPDQWKISSQAASLQTSQLDATSETGLKSRWMGAFKQITNSGKFLIMQPILGRDSMHMRGNAYTFQVQMKASSAKTIRMAVIELNSSGTMDTIPATFVTTWGANTVDPTLGSNLAVVTGAQSKSVTTSMQLFSVTVTLPSTSKNYCLAVWTDSQFAAGDILYLAEAGFYQASTTQTWIPKKLSQETLDCEYFARAYRWNGSGDTNLAFGGAINTQIIFAILSFQDMRVAPATSGAVVGSATDYKCSNAGGTGVVCAVLPSISSMPNSITVFGTVASGLVAGGASAFQLSTSAAAIILDSGL